MAKANKTTTKQSEPSKNPSDSASSTTAPDIEPQQDTLQGSVAGDETPAADSDAPDQAPAADAAPLVLTRSAEDLQREYQALSEATVQMARKRPSVAKEIESRVRAQMGDFDGGLAALKERKRQAFNAWQAAIELETAQNGNRADAVAIEQAQKEMDEKAKKNAERKTELELAHRRRLAEATR